MNQKKAGLIHPSSFILYPSGAAAPPWGWLEAYVLVLFLSSGVLLLPGTHSIRTAVRALPYLGSLALLLGVPGLRGALAPPGRSLLVAGLAVMALGALLPGSNLVVGCAQLVFQLSILAPVFWAGGLVREPARLERLLALTFLANAASCVVGLLQVFDPERFLPAEFSSPGREGDVNFVQSLTYRAADGRTIVRPCGLTDLPGGAAVGSAVTGLLGLMLAAQPGRAWWQRGVCLLLAGAGMLTLFLTQVRSLLLVLVAVGVVLCVVLARLGRATQATMLAFLGGGLLAGAFVVASAVGGDAVFDRFHGILEQGVVGSYQQNRGIFLEYTFTTLLWEYPLGAGMGRCGMMYAYFSRFEGNPSPPVHVEIQVTAWLLDGGILLLVLYGAAVGMSLWFAWQQCSADAPPRVGYMAAVVLCLNLFVVGQSNAGPCFNTTVGIQFWMLAAALHGVVARGARRGRGTPASSDRDRRRDPCRGT
jgi:hypothetical protein